MFISKKKHDAIVADLKEDIDYLEKRLVKATDLKEVLTTLVADRKNYLIGDSLSFVDCVSGSYELNLPDTVPVYVDDIFGGKVIKQEATPVTKLDKKGKATYGYTKTKPSKGKEYLLIQE